nr:NAD(P)-binding domain-containing protein [Streptomyces sp. Wb2n-11]
MRANTVCVIGAGPSGLAASKVLASRGIHFDCYEAGSGIGGLWRFGNDNGMSGIYESLHTNISREGMAFDSLPMPDDYPIFPHHRQVLAYLESYARTYSLYRHMRFRTEVTAARPRPDGDWEVVHQRRGEPQEETRRHTAVIVANGHHWDPRFPGPPIAGADTFEGPMVHSHDYRTPRPYANKRVLVVGMGNSACEISAEISRTAARTFLSTRSGAHVIPRVILGRPADRLAASPLTGLPLFVKRPVLNLALRLSRGRVTDYGLPEPDHRLLSAHPTCSDELFVQLVRGAITAKPGVAKFSRDHAVFTDGSREQVDAVVYATGYKLSFPFLSPSVFSAEDGRTDLYLRTVPVDRAGLYFMGLAQPSGAAFPLLEEQAEWIADLIDGSALPPPPVDMARANRRERRRHDRIYSHSYRHGIEVDCRTIRRALARERRAGRRRLRDAAPAAPRSPGLPVPGPRPSVEPDTGDRRGMPPGRLR